MLEPILECQALSYLVPSKKILENLSFTIPKGSFTVVVGENGAGKTTLLKLLMGFCKPSSGKILLNGNEPHLDPYEDRQTITYVSERQSPPIDWSVREYLDFNRYFYKSYSSGKEKQLLSLFRLSETARIGQLSTGETRRIQVVAALATSPTVMIIDEITAVLDIVGRHTFMSLLKDLRGERQSSIFMATNIIDDVDQYATHVLLLEQGRLITCGTKDELKKNAGTTLSEKIAQLIESSQAGGR